MALEWLILLAWPLIGVAAYGWWRLARGTNADVASGVLTLAVVTVVGVPMFGSLLNLFTTQ